MAVSGKKTKLLAAAFMIFAAALVSFGPLAFAGEWASAIKNKLNPVQTIRDDKGAWFVTGEETAPLRDVFEAVGYAVAFDRLWQAELFRRTGRGAMAEILGPDFLAADILIRTINRSDEEIETAFQNLKQEEKDVIEGYVAGFNRRIEDVEADPSLLPFEFKALGFSPAPWTYLDVMAWTANLLRNFDPEATSQYQVENMSLYLSLAEAFPADFRDMFEDLRWTNDPEALTVIRAGTETASASSVRAGTLGRSGKSRAGQFDPNGLPDLRKAAQRIVDTRKQIEENLKKANAFVKMGSYAWAVAGSKTASGNPIIYSGPQMGFSVPAICQEGSIQAGGLHVSGMAVPGVPGLLIGRTPHHAWSMQVANAHTTDFYIEFPSDVYFHRYETIRVAGAEDVVLPVYRSSHGPIVNPMPYDESAVGIFNPPIAWKYSHWETEDTVTRAILGMAKAESIDEFGAAIEFVPVSMHFCYADIDGSIAYWMSGRDPVRPEGEWRLPQGFFTLQGVPQLEWDANVLKPRSTEKNTPLGFYGGWNNKNAPDAESGFNQVTKQFGVFNRAHVIDEYLTSHDELTFDDLRDLALNIATTDSMGLGGNPWQFASPYFTSAVAEAGENSQRQAALDLLSAWDGHFPEGGESEWAAGENLADAWVLMDSWIREVLSLSFEDELGELYESESALVLFNVLLHGLSGENAGIVNRYDWFSNLSDPAAPQTASDIIVAALDATLSKLGERPWGVGQRDEIILEHDLLGEVHSLPFSNRSTFAHIVEFAPEGPVRVESMFLLGQSGTILMDDTGAPVFDDNFFSMAPIYDTFAHRTFPVPE